MKTKPGGKRIVYGRIVRNVAAPELIQNQLSHYTINLSMAGVKVRKETLAGRDYTVVPAVIMKEGVLNGSRGPMLYPAEELEQHPETWNHKPVVVNHPPDDSSACTPEVLNDRQIGLLMNTAFDKKKRLTTEAWIDEELCKIVDKRVWNSIEKKKVMEMSTGLFTDNELTEGEFEGTSYTAIARNYRPDHLAVLPDTKGALSVDQGGGFIRNELRSMYPGMDSDDTEILRSTVINLLTRDAPKGKTGLLIKMLTANEASHEETRGQLYSALQTKFPPPTGDDPGYNYPYIEAVYDGTVIFCLGGKLYGLGYTQSSAGIVKLDGTPREVVRVSEYRTKTGAAVINADTSKLKTNKEVTMDKKTMVSELISNHGYSEESRKTLMALDDNTVAMVHHNATAAAKADPGNEADEDDVTGNDGPKAAAKKEADEKKAAADKKKKKAPAKNEEADETEDDPAPAPTAEEYIENAPAGVREMLKDGLMARNAERTALIKKITSNKQNSFDKAELDGMQLNALRKLAKLADGVAQNTTSATDEVIATRFDGMAPVAMLTANEAKEEDALQMPSTWDEPAKK